ncbi:hypothetical protein BU24DRAFT_103878 [Aaosphaeria arxii CBS 175.79]|uniref:Uncharacterized protein n=1 Tax=Aaosphaeria arxii CBS 175.79 TaxID=1450172 RepID=A0A6A5XZK8_9PLEO|nr:uncharacterized protein BU24DRAFT_103878 [Aaosphaeria arxii CBS 175.79]KAF2018735.1 hypothetical protein BU24DRAFT_103878 [Aaosphaeria arxii CBS 175.79]
MIRGAHYPAIALITLVLFHPIAFNAVFVVYHFPYQTHDRVLWKPSTHHQDFDVMEHIRKRSVVHSHSSKNVTSHRPSNGDQTRPLDKSTSPTHQPIQRHQMEALSSIPPVRNPNHSNSPSVVSQSNTQPSSHNLSQDLQSLTLSPSSSSTSTDPYNESIADRNIRQFGSSSNSTTSLHPTTSATNNDGEAASSPPRTSSSRLSNGGDLLSEADKFEHGNKHRRDDSGFYDVSTSQHPQHPTTSTPTPPNLNGILDLTNTTDTDKTTTWAPAVHHTTHTTHLTHVRHDLITRDIHTHEVHHRVQPVIAVPEILPARHFVPSTTAKGELVEVDARDVPEEWEQRWGVDALRSKLLPPPARDGDCDRGGESRGEEEEEKGGWGWENDTPVPLRRRFEVPRVVGDVRYVTEGGFERRVTTYLHPPTLEDGGNGDGEVLPVHFGEGGVVVVGEVGRRRRCCVGDGEGDGVRGGTVIPSELVPERRSSKRCGVGASGREGEDGRQRGVEVGRKKLPSMLDV